MRIKSIHILLFLFLILVFGAIPAAASESGAQAHGNAQAIALEGAHGLIAQAEHEDAVEAHGSAATVAAEAHAEEGEHVSKSVTPTKLKDFFWRTVNFIALLVLLIYFLAKPIGNALVGRQQNVIDEIKTLEAKRDAAERSYKEFESRLAGMEKEMEAVVERAIAQAETEKAKILADAEKTAEDIKRQAAATIQAELVEARRSLRDEIADQAAAMAEELIVKNLTPEDQVKITEQYLDRVGAVQ
ncbi:MAG: ATP synthase F0 subunit B [Desulfobulbaceae bacterium]|nr:ATP synthase F0 subunit B [Desulfobulbaceae bacterium]